MSCKDSKISRMLPDYWSGHLGLEDQQVVERHLTQCPECRSELCLMDTLAGRYSNKEKSKAENHISLSLIATYYEDKSSLSADQIRTIESHLDDCDMCAYELDFLRSMEQDLSRSVESHVHKAFKLEDISRALMWLVRKPVFAYFMLLLTLYPTYRWIEEPSGGRYPEDHHLFQVERFIVGEASRGVNEIPDVVRTSENPLVMLLIPFYHLTEKYSYEFSVSAVDETESIDANLVPDFQKDAIILILLDTRKLTDGNYTLEVTETGIEDSTDFSAKFFSFNLRTR